MITGCFVSFIHHDWLPWLNVLFSKTGFALLYFFTPSSNHHTNLKSSIDSSIPDVDQCVTFASRTKGCSTRNLPKPLQTTFRHSRNGVIRWGLEAIPHDRICATTIEIPTLIDLLATSGVKWGELLLWNHPTEVSENYFSNPSVSENSRVSGPHDIFYIVSF